MAEIRSLPSMDYRDLLKKYMAAVICNEGVDFIPGHLSEEETAELEKISAELTRKEIYGRD